MKKFLLVAALCCCGLAFGQLNENYHSLSSGAFTQDWSSSALITSNDDWSNVPSITGYLGGDLPSGDVQTITGSSSTQDVIAGSSGSSSSGGVHEIDGDVIGLQGSGSADAPYLEFRMDASGVTNVAVAYTLKELDANNASQEVALQYRLNDTDSWTNVADGYVADASNGAGQETSVNVILPSETNGVSTLQIRVITDNANGSDSMIGIDDISISGTATSSPLVGFDSSSSDEVETSSNFTTSIPVTLSNYGGSQVDLIVSVTGGSAEAGDYTLNTSSLSFTSSTTQNISIDINSDSDIEDETIEITIAETTSTGISISPSIHTIVITDDDTPNILISEIMYNSTGTDDEWIEIYNNEGSTIDVSNWTFEIGGATNFTFPISTNLSAGEYYTLAIGSNGDGTYNNENEFEPDFNSLGVANSEVAGENSTNKLVNSSQTLTLKTDGGTVVNEVSFDDADDDRTDGDGPSYEIIDLDADNSVTSANWQASPADGGSPGSASAVIFWDGSSSTDWSTASNWEGNVLPTSSHNVIILDVSQGSRNSPIVPSSVVGELYDLTINTGASLSVESGGSLAIYGSATVDGSFTVTRNMTGGTGAANSAGYSIAGSPVSTGEIQDFDAQFIHGYTNSTGYSANLSGSADALAAGVGYFVGYDAVDPGISFVGTPNTGDITYTVTETSGFELVANPYTAAISTSSFVTDNSSVITGGVYFWDDGGSNVGSSRGGDFITVTAMGTATAVQPNGTDDGVAGSKGTSGSDNGFIPSVQGVFVEVQAAGDITFSPSQIATSSSANSDANHYRVVGYQKVKLAIEGNGLYNEILVGLGEDATFGRDNHLDAKKIVTDNPLSFYSLINDERFMIQGLPLAQNSDISAQLGFDLAKEGEYTLRVVAMENIPADLIVSLKDQLTGEVYQLDNTSSINFNSVMVNNDQRFELTFSSVEVSAVEESFADLKVYGSLGGLTIEFLAEGRQEVVIYDLAGKRAFRDEIVFTNNRSLINPSLEKGKVYILRIQEEAFKFVIK